MTNHNDLLDAALNNNLARARIAIVNGAKISETVICAAAANCNLEFFMLLDANGADLSKHSYAAGSWAMKYGNWDIVQYIANFNVNSSETLYAQDFITNDNFKQVLSYDAN